jgi:hypothetical protein
MSSSPAVPVTSHSPRLRLLSFVFGAILLLYLVDFAWYETRLHFPKFGAATGSVHRIRLLAIPNKANNTTFELDQVHPEEDVPCSHSLFPQGGGRPCWYVTRHANDPIPI